MAGRVVMMAPAPAAMWPNSASPNWPARSSGPLSAASATYVCVARYPVSADHIHPGIVISASRTTAQGRVTTYPNSSKYQIVIESMEPAGIGALMALLEERKRKFAAEGMFDDARKRALPFLPTMVGIVTSPTGAVIRDMLHGFNERFPAHVVLWPVRVQGDTSAAEVAAAIRGFNQLPAARDAPPGALRRPDVLIVARGGGSLEDLWGFNEEMVVRAAAESAIPLISAVGHETDTTLIDHAADRRAPTPTAAAELAVPVRRDLLATLEGQGARLVQAQGL